MAGVVETGLGQRTRRWLAAWAWLVFAFLYVPIVVLVIFSFNASSRVNIWGGSRFSGTARHSATR